MRSEFFSHAMSGRTLASLLTQFGDHGTMGRREITFTAMGGAYNKVAEDATAFAHRSECFLLEHIADAADPWVDRSWAIAHADGSGRVYPNFPDPALDDWGSAYHAGNHPGWQRSRTPMTRTDSSTFPKPSDHSEGET